MHWVLDDNLNMIVIERPGYLLNYACELDRIEWNNSFFLNNYRTID